MPKTLNESNDSWRNIVIGVVVGLWWGGDWGVASQSWECPVSEELHTLLCCNARSWDYSKRVGDAGQVINAEWPICHRRQGWLCGSEPIDGALPRFRLQNYPERGWESDQTCYVRIEQRKWASLGRKVTKKCRTMSSKSQHSQSPSLAWTFLDTSLFYHGLIGWAAYWAESWKTEPGQGSEIGNIASDHVTTSMIGLPWSRSKATIMD